MSDGLFDRMGGAEGVAAIVNDMYDRVLADEELAPFFKDVAVDRLRRMQFEFIASAFGGPVHYSGAEIQAIHSGRGITAHHFTKFIGYLAQAMEARGATQADVDEMLGLVAMARDRIVGGGSSGG